MSPSAPPAERERGRIVERFFFDLGATAQATVPGAYAWAVTVAPVAFGRGAPRVARALALLGLVLLAAPASVERRRPGLARVVSIWGLVSTSLAVWIIAPGPTQDAQVHADTLRGVAGTIGWGLFALASCAPALPRSRESTPSPAEPLRRRGDSGRIDATILAVGAGLALVLVTGGWQTGGVERALLVRLVTLAAGVMIVGSASSLVAARHARRRTAAPARRVKRALLPLVLLGLLTAGAAIYSLAVGR